MSLFAPTLLYVPSRTGSITVYSIDGVANTTFAIPIFPVNPEVNLMLDL
jgi:hypothetical protein